MRVLRIGMLGLGRVGSAVVRSAGPAASWIASSGLKFLFDRALVRDLHRPGRPNVPLVDHPEAFLAGEYDLVVEVLGGIEPARSLVVSLLERGTPVVTANKSLLAAAADELAAAAVRGGTVLRYEASALAGVPFLGTFGARPLARAVERLAGIVNGTSNYILSAMETDGLSFAEALARAQALGLAEPDPAADVEGRDAREKLIVLLGHFGADIAPEAVETAGIDALDTDDLKVAWALGGRIRPVVYARVGPSAMATDLHRCQTVECFVGPAFVEAGDPLADVSGVLNGIRLDGRFARDLFFSGPGAGPEVTAATILDDVVQAVNDRTSSNLSNPLEPRRTRSNLLEPSTAWFLRLEAPSRAPEVPLVADLLAANGVSVVRTSSGGSESAARLWVLTGLASRQSIDAATQSLSRVSGTRTLALRVLERRAPIGSEERVQLEIEQGALSGVEG